MSRQNNHTLKVGTVIEDKWIVLEFLGKGGMGEVYRAHQLNLKRDVAVKIISREWLESVQDNEEEREVGLQRFRNEVLSMAQVRHPNLLQIHDYGSFSFEKGEASVEFEYIVMEYIPGGTLRSTMSDDGFYDEEDLVRDWVVDYFVPVLDGVQALHEAGIIHRDLKPGNILMDGETPRITDFGLARSAKIGRVTLSTDIKGTPAYMSPEHFMDLKRADHRSDIYSLGKMLYEVIDGKIGPETIPLKSAHLNRAESAFFKKFDEIIQTATAEDRNGRYQSVEDLRKAILEAVQIKKSSRHPEKTGEQGIFHPISRPQWVWGGVALAVLLVMSMALWHLLGDTEPPPVQPKAPSAALPDRTPSGPPLPPSGDAVEPEPSQPLWEGRDGARLHLISGGELFPQGDEAGNRGTPLKIPPFYMDETEVTNHQYAAFLNQVLSRVRVEEDAVRSEDRLWLLLGEAARGYEPIIFQNGKFVVKDPIYHSHPVVRVTAYGAAAYADYYGRRLPTSAEWLYALRTGNQAMPETSSATPQQPAMSHTEMMHGGGQFPSMDRQSPSERRPVSVTQSRPNAYGIRGLEENVNEWCILAPEDSPKKAKGSYGVFPEAVGRRPWEAFEDVGFRTVLPVPEG